MSKYLKLLFYLIIGLIVFFLAFSFIDPDFGWHLAAGNLILKSGFPKTDPFSYTMPSFPFIEPEWTADIIFAKLYPVAGQFGMAALFSIFFLLAIFISISQAKKFKKVLFIVGVSSLISFFTASPKVFSWLVFAVFSAAVLNDNFWKKYWYLLPIIVLLWANTHGSFPEALIILGVIVICKSFREKRIWLKGVVVSILSFLATLINPYGLKNWWIVLLTVSDPFLKYRIVEFQPTFVNPLGISFLTIFLFTLSAIIIFKYRRKFRPEVIILNLIFFAQAMFAIRNVTLWVLFDLSMVAVALGYFYSDIVRGKIRKMRFLKLSKITFLFVSLVFISQCLVFGYSYFKFNKEDIFYPEGSILFLQKNPPSGQIFSMYNWGGYLIWKLPQKKVFIYGMAPLFRWQENIQGESNYAMTDYMNVIAGKIPYKPEFDKYNINTALLPYPDKKESKIGLIERVGLFLGLLKNTGSKNTLYNELTKDGWREVYYDSVSIILEKP